MRTAVIAGATGLIGAELLDRLLASDRYAKVVVVGRRAPDIEHTKLQAIITDFSDLGEALEGTTPDDVFCCLGTTMAKAKTRENFYKVDFQYPVDLASRTLALGARQFLIVTALGADKTSSIYYNRVKGEVEEAITALAFGTTHIFRPSLLLGDRDEKRAGEDVAKKLYRVLDFLIPLKYKGITAERVANAMLNAAEQDDEGVHVHSSAAMQRHV